MRFTRVTDKKSQLTFWCIVSTITYDIIDYGWGIREGTKRMKTIQAEHPAQGFLFCTAWE